MRPESGRDSATPLFRCLNPESIAVIGGAEAERVVWQCAKMGYGGPIWAVNPQRPTLGDRVCLPDIGSLPQIPDVAFVAVPADLSVEMVRALAEMGAGGAVCYASGFQEVGAEERHQRLLDAAGEMPLIGPNCYGFINALNGAVLWPDQHGLRRCDAGVAIFSASGNIGINLTMQQRGLPIAFMVSIGNQATVGMEALLSVMLEDERVTAVGLLMEGLRDLPRFVEVASRAIDRGKPVVVIKNGRSAAGARIALSHTATLTGEARLYDALFQRLGVAQVPDLETFLETLKILAVGGPIRGNRIASLSCSGGEASLVADLAQHHDLCFPPLQTEHRQQVARTLNRFVHVENPLDYHTFIWGDETAMEATFTTMMQGGFDLTVMILDFPGRNDCDPTDWMQAGRAFARAVHRSGAPGALIVSLTENVTEPILAEFAAQGIPVLMGIPQALGAMDAAARVGRLRDPLPTLPQATFGPRRQDGLVPVKRQILTEPDAKERLAHHGIRIPRGALVNTAHEAAIRAHSLGFPVVMKVVSEQVVHKSDQGGVLTGLKDEAAVRAAAAQLLAVSDQVLVEEMVCDGQVELLLGLVRDPQFGHYFTVGAGGIWVELLADRQILLPPLSVPMIRESLQTLRMAPLLNGYRGSPPADLEAVIESLLILERLATEMGPQLSEVEINPLIVRSSGGGAVAVDAFMAVDRTEDQPPDVY